VGYHSTNTIYVDTDKIKFPLQLRKWSEGDVFQPFGMKGKKKLSKFFKDEKLSLVAKENIWVLCSNKQIMWVIGHRPDERFKVTPETKQILKITRTT
jgi:tRNA(Ile)-lysidine synthase